MEEKGVEPVGDAFVGKLLIAPVVTRAFHDLEVVELVKVFTELLERDLLGAILVEGVGHLLDFTIMS